MSTVRRKFFAMVGNAIVSGLVTRRSSAAAPELILPPATLFEPTRLLPPRESSTPAVKSLDERFAEIVNGLPDDLFEDWFAGGLRMVKGCKPGGMIWRAMQIDAAAGDDTYRTWLERERAAHLLGEG